MEDEVEGREGNDIKLAPSSVPFVSLIETLLVNSLKYVSHYILATHSHSPD